MIKRRFYKLDKGDRSGSSDSDDSSSSDEDSGGHPEAHEEEVEEVDEWEEEEEEVEVEPLGSKRRRAPSPDSGYESEESSGNELVGDPTGLLLSDDDDDNMPPEVVENTKDIQLNKRVKTKENKKVSIENITTDLDNSIDTDYILISKSVFKCKLCPRIVCLNEESLKAHLQSKRHSRSRKLLGEGRLKLMLNSDGEIEEDQETHAERHARIIALSKKAAKEKESEAPREKESEAPQEKESRAPKNDSGRKRQSLRRKKKKLNHPEKCKEEKSKEKPASKRHRI